MPFTYDRPVRFQDVDYAQVVYYPRLFSYCHEAFEEFFGREVGQTYAAVVADRRIGFPTVHAEADFSAPFRFGELCRVVLDVPAIGQSSLTCRYRLLGSDGKARGEVRVVTASVDLDRFSAVSLPEDVRGAFERHSPPSAAQ